MITKYYSDLNIKSDLISKEWKTIVDNNNQWIRYYGFDALVLQPSYWLQDPALRIIHEKFPFSKCGILRIPPYENYDWHRDYDRGVCVNMLLSTDITSYCMFSDTKDLNVPQAQHCSFEVLDYQPDTFYLFNNQQTHTLYNFDKPRYLFSSEFVYDKHQLSYEMIRDWAKENNYVSE